MEESHSRTESAFGRYGHFPPLSRCSIVLLERKQGPPASHVLNFSHLTVQVCTKERGKCSDMHLTEPLHIALWCMQALLCLLQLCFHAHFRYSNLEICVFACVSDRETDVRSTDV